MLLAGKVGAVGEPHRVDFRAQLLQGELRDFTWNDFCDWYVEFLKGRLRDPETRPVAQRVLATVLDGLCRLLHPIVPFLTEQVWQAMAEVAPVRGLGTPGRAAESVCIAPWPGFPETLHDPEAESVVARWRETIAVLRNLRAERNVPAAAKIAPILVAIGPSAEALRQVLDPLRYRNLDEVGDFAGRNTTSEVLAQWIADRLTSELRDGKLGPASANVSALVVTLRESHVAWASYERDL